MMRSARVGLCRPQGRALSGAATSRLVPFRLGDPGTPEFRVFLARRDANSGSAAPASYWHDVGVVPGDAGAGALAAAPGPKEVRFVCEIPRGTRDKLEMMHGEEHNPIGQDRYKCGALRAYRAGDSPFNYGFVPQTVEAPERLQHGLRGDGDPVDVVEIGHSPMEVGEVRDVVLLGALALVDEGELDWKLLALRADNPFAGEPDVLARRYPNAVAEVRRWFETYKIADGKPRNAYLFDGEFQDAEAAADVVRHAHEDWRRIAKQ